MLVIDMFFSFLVGSIVIILIILTAFAYYSLYECKKRYEVNISNIRDKIEEILRDIQLINEKGRHIETSRDAIKDLEIKISSINLHLERILDFQASHHAQCHNSRNSRPNYVNRL